MKPLRAFDIALATAGALVAGDGDASIDCVCTDTRAMRPASLFIPIVGETFDAHDHVAQAVAGGARVVLTHRWPLEGTADTAVVRVDDTRRALGRLANHVRRGFERTTVIAVAGSNGKTGTKHLIHGVLSRSFSGSMSPKSFNNDVGVPLTLFAVQPDDDFVVVEIGTNHPGEVRHLSLMCEPDLAVITSIGEEHMEFFCTLDGVRREQAEITAGLRAGGHLLICGDDEGLGALLPQAMTFGLAEGNDLQATAITAGLDGVEFETVRSNQNIDCPRPTIASPARFALALAGRHNASNALAAIAIGRFFGADDATIARGLAEASSPEMRMQRRAVGGITILNDAYNANPTSVRAAIRTLADAAWAGRKIVVLGEMRELGGLSAAAHRDIAGLMTIALPTAETFYIGPAYAFVASDGHRHYADARTAVADVAAFVREGDLVLLKASRGLRLERVEAAIVERFA